MARPTNPALWNQIKATHRASSNGGEPGRWSARKAVLAQLEYRRRGGDWQENAGPPPGMAFFVRSQLSNSLKQQR
jgi:hypothetical protein